MRLPGPGAVALFLLCVSACVIGSALGAGVVATTAAGSGGGRGAVAVPWRGQTVRDLHREYSNIFRYGNRNAASHRWSTFLLERSQNFDAEQLAYFFSGFCAVSGSPINPSDYNRYGLTLDAADGTKVAGHMHYCCWPCVCDTQDFIKVDTRNVTLKGGESQQFHFVVIGNPCDHEEMLNVPFVQPFDRRQTTLSREAQEVRCTANGELEGATLSDHGFPIISMFFNPQSLTGEAAGMAAQVAVVRPASQQPGRLSRTASGVPFQSEAEYFDMCTNRANQGYNSGMGEIFRKVAAISPVQLPVAVSPAPVV